MIVSVRHDQREKPNNLKLVQRTKVLIHNRLADKAKARLPTFSHNMHLVVHYISLTLKNIHQMYLGPADRSDIRDSIMTTVLCMPAAARARSAQGASQFAAGHAAARLVDIDPR